MSASEPGPDKDVPPLNVVASIADPSARGLARAIVVLAASVAAIAGPSTPPRVSTTRLASWCSRLGTGRRRR
jgi:hypothetical protein